MDPWPLVAGVLLGCSSPSAPSGSGAGPVPPPPPPASGNGSMGAPPPPSQPPNFGAFLEAGRVVSLYRAGDRAGLLRMATPRAQAEIAQYDFTAPSDWRTAAFAGQRGVGPAVRAQGDRVLVEGGPIGLAEVALIALQWVGGRYAFDGFVRMTHSEYEAVGPRL